MQISKALLSIPLVFAIGQFFSGIDLVLSYPLLLIATKINCELFVKLCLSSKEEVTSNQKVLPPSFLCKEQKKS